MGRVARLTILALSVTTAVIALASPAAAETLRITEPPSAMAGTVTVPFTYTFTARPGTGVPPYRFRLHTDSGPMPLGLTLNENTGVLSGAPTAYGTWIFRVTVFDAISAASSTGQITFNVNVLPMALGPGPAATIPALVNYQFQFGTTGGMPPYTYSMPAGTLPTGMTVTSTGLLVGAPHQIGTFTFTVRTRDVLNTTVSRAITLTVVSPAIIGLPPSSIEIGRPFSHTFTTTPGRIGSVKFERLTGFLPTGLSLSSGGVLSGTPTVIGTYRAVIVATFTVGTPPVATFEDYKQISISVVSPPPAPTTPAPTTKPPDATIPGASQASSTSPVPTGSTVTTPGHGDQVPTAGAPADGAGTLAENGRMGGAAAWLCAVLTVVAVVAVLLVLLYRRRRQAAGPPDA